MMTNAKLVGVYHEDDPSDEDGSPVGSGRITKTVLFSFDYLLIFEEIRCSVMGLRKKKTHDCSFFPLDMYYIHTILVEETTHSGGLVSLAGQKEKSHFRSHCTLRYQRLPT